MNNRLKRQIFLGECVIILVLIIVISAIIDVNNGSYGEKHGVIAKENESVVEKEDIREIALDEYAEHASTEPVDVVSLMENSENKVEQIDDQQESTQEETVEETQIQESRSIGESTSPADDGIIQIAVFGDSIWDDYRGTDGVSEVLADTLNAVVHNCAVGGTSASVTDSSTYLETWDNRSANGMMYVAKGDISADTLLEGYESKDIIKTVDFETVDYVIFSYGLNDYFMGAEIGIDDTYGMYDLTTYAGALRHAVSRMQITYPQAQYIMIGPTFCKVFEGKNQIGTSDTYSNGEGTIGDYALAAEAVANELGAVYIDMFEDFIINGDNIDEYSYDGVHLSTQGRKEYALRVVDTIATMEAEKQ